MSPSRCTLLVLALVLAGCSFERQAAMSLLGNAQLQSNPLQGDFAPVHDPSIIAQHGVYYLFNSDRDVASPTEHLPIRCSPDKIVWTPCGFALSAIPAWITAQHPEIHNLWAPDISFFHGLFHLYYAASFLGSQASVIGLLTTPTLDRADPAYAWTDHGPVLASHPGDDFNAIDPNIFIDTDQRVWLTYGSYWSGILQREIEAATGLLAADPTRYHLATRTTSPDNAIEGSSLVQHNGFYFLFLSVDHCCAAHLGDDNYKQMVGRSLSPHGPFADALGTPLLQNGGSILLEADAAHPSWRAPGGGAAYLNPATGESLLVFHALNADQGGQPTLWLKTLTWQDDWPVLN